MRADELSKFAGIHRRTIALGCLTCCWCAASCAVDLDPRARPKEASEAPELDACRPLPAAKPVLAGRLLSWSAETDETLLITSTPDAALGETFAVSGDPCDQKRATVSAPVFELSALGLETDDLSVQPLSLFTEDKSYAYFALITPDGSVSGYGIALWDPMRKRFLAGSLLWTADRPNYGSAAVVADGYVYVYGGLAARFLDADIYVARAPLSAVTEPEAYEYAQSGGGWESDVDRASPIVTGGAAPSVAWHPGKKRWLMAYATPLAQSLTVRSGLGPRGPWSAPVVLGRCDLPDIDPDAFCGEVTLQAPYFGKREIALAHTVGSFARPDSAQDRDYATRWLTAAWPDALP